MRKPALIFSIIMGAVIAVIIVTTLPLVLLTPEEAEEIPQIGLTVPGCVEYKSYELGKNILVTVCKMQNTCFLDIREFLKRKNGTYFATIKGIQLSVKNWETLKSNVILIDKTINQM